MSYFKSFPKEFYQFGDDPNRAVMQNITAYVEIFDQARANASFYQDYYIKEGERADHVSQYFYDTPQLHWTFWMMNNHIRERGWPLTRKQVLAKVQRDYSGLVLNTSEDVSNKFHVGQQVTGMNGSGTVVERNLQLGQVVLTDVSGYFGDGEQITSQVQESLETLLVDTSSKEHLATRYYVNADGDKVDVQPFAQPPSNVVPVTHQEFYLEENDSLRQIRVVRPNAMGSIVSAYRKAMRSL